MHIRINKSYFILLLFVVSIIGCNKEPEFVIPISLLRGSNYPLIPIHENYLSGRGCVKMIICYRSNSDYPTIYNYDYFGNLLSKKFHSNGIDYSIIYMYDEELKLSRYQVNSNDEIIYDLDIFSEWNDDNTVLNVIGFKKGSDLRQYYETQKKFDESIILSSFTDINSSAMKDIHYYHEGSRIIQIDNYLSSDLGVKRYFYEYDANGLIRYIITTKTDGETPIYEESFEYFDDKIIYSLEFLFETNNEDKSIILDNLDEYGNWHKLIQLGDNEEIKFQINREIEYYD